MAPHKAIGIDGMAVVTCNVHGTKAVEERTVENAPTIQDEALATRDLRH
jgi:hypothetical protein